MHLQIRAAPVQSPPNLADFLAVIAKEGINILTAGGSNIEQGGEFAFAVSHEDQCRAVEALAEAGYEPRVVTVDWGLMTDKPGQLLECVARVAAQNAATGKTIVDIAIGGPDADGRIPIQIYSR
jgi:hypothetical protein